MNNDEKIEKLRKLSFLKIRIDDLIIYHDYYCEEKVNEITGLTFYEFIKIQNIN